MILLILFFFKNCFSAQSGENVMKCYFEREENTKCNETLLRRVVPFEKTVKVLVGIYAKKSLSGNEKSEAIMKELLLKSSEIVNKNSFSWVSYLSSDDVEKFLVNKSIRRGKDNKLFASLKKYEESLFNQDLLKKYQYRNYKYEELMVSDFHKEQKSFPVFAAFLTHPFKYKKLNERDNAKTLQKREKLCGVVVMNGLDCRENTLISEKLFEKNKETNKISLKRESKEELKKKIQYIVKLFADAVNNLFEKHLANKNINRNLATCVVNITKLGLGQCLVNVAEADRELISDCYLEAYYEAFKYEASKIEGRNFVLQFFNRGGDCKEEFKKSFKEIEEQNEEFKLREEEFKLREIEKQNEEFKLREEESIKKNKKFKIELKLFEEESIFSHQSNMNYDDEDIFTVFQYNSCPDELCVEGLCNDYGLGKAAIGEGNDDFIFLFPFIIDSMNGRAINGPATEFTPFAKIIFLLMGSSFIIIIGYRYRTNLMDTINYLRNFRFNIF